MFGFGVLCTSVLTLLTPLAANGGIGWLLTVRVLEGIGEVNCVVFFSETVAAILIKFYYVCHMLLFNFKAVPGVEFS